VGGPIKRRAFLKKKNREENRKYGKPSVPRRVFKNYSIMSIHTRETNNPSDRGKGKERRSVNEAIEG